jgi:copper chaperone CopZ
MRAKSAGVLAAVMGSICCIGPLLSVAVGVGAGATVIGRYDWFFIGGAIVVLTWAWAKYLREKTVCDCEDRQMEGRRGPMFTLLIATMIVFGFVALNVSAHVFESSPQPSQTQVANGLTRVVIPVESMSCATCEIAVGSALKRVNGVATARVSVATKTAMIDYDPTKTNSEQLVAAINAPGNRASLPQK